MARKSAAAVKRTLASGLHEKFSNFSQTTAHLTGHPAAFMLAFVVIVVWAVTGPMFHYSDTWQLVINTGTTIVTFLMVFLIQNTQNRDTLALQLKLSELVLAVEGAKNTFAAIEDMSDEDLERLHKESRKRVEAVIRERSGRRTQARAGLRNSGGAAQRTSSAQRTGSRN
jgi:low affinity Fe/Cu permease